MVDEFHERGVNVDAALALARAGQASGLREDDPLTMIVMSATLLGDEEEERRLVDALGGVEVCAVIRSEGRRWPVEYRWPARGAPPHGALLRDQRLLVSATADAAEDALRIAPDRGDVLVFLPGAREIRNVVRALLERRSLDGIDVLPLYGALPRAEQDEVVTPSSSSSSQRPRRVIVSSPIAEASLTLPRVTCVVDSGLRREPRRDARTGLPGLVTARCSRDAAAQRAGRAGRTGPGVCVRLYDEASLERNFPARTTPEILRADLTATASLLAAWGVSRPEDVATEVHFVDPPPTERWEEAYDALVSLGALERTEDGRRKATKLGKQVARSPAPPRLATAVAVAERDGDDLLLGTAAIAAALLDGEDGSRVTNGDLDAAVEKAAASSGTTKRVLRYASRLGRRAERAAREVLASPVSGLVGRALLPGLRDSVAAHRGDASYGGASYALACGTNARLDRDDDDHDPPPAYLVATETSTGDDGVTRIRTYASVPSETLLADPRHARAEDVVFTVPSKGHEVRARRVVRWGALELSSAPLAAPSPEDATRALLDALRDNGGVRRLLPTGKKARSAVAELRARVRLARTDDDEEDEWPPCFATLDALDDDRDDEHQRDAHERVLETLVEPWLAAAGSLGKLDLARILFDTLDPAQRRTLDARAPISVVAPDGSSIPVSYDAADDDGRPTATAKLQTFFGCAENPAVGVNGNVPVTLSLTSPGNRVLVRTADLAFFWREAYPQVRAEMRGRYPKHPWPEDPWTADPTRRTKKQLAAATATAEGDGEGSGDVGSDAKKRKKKGRGKRRKK